MKELFPGTSQEFGKCAEVENLSSTEGNISFADIMEFSDVRMCP